MILDNIKNKELYYKLGEGFKIGLDFIDKCRAEGIEVGKYELDGKNVYANVQEYNSKEEAKFENHDNYIDIQYILSGNEMMYWEDLAKCTEMIPYNPEKDVTFYNDTDSAVALEVNEDEFAVFFPNDVHKPGMKINESLPVKKILIKIHV